MSKVRIILSVSALLLLALSAGAQQRPFDRLVDINPWLYGSNYAGIRQDTTAGMSYAELSAGAEAGDFRRSYEASSLWKAGVKARTIKHVERFSMIGGFSFDQQVGKDMCASMFIRPGFYPVDVMEFTPGQKTLQTYAFDGGVSVDIARGLRLGAGMDFTSANYSKRKDLRHTNYMLDMEASAGLSYTAGGFTLGASYIYRKDSESVDAEQIGTGESSYYAFLDKGLCYRKYEVWSGSGVHLDEAGVQGFPVKESLHGAGLQVGYGRSWYLDVEYLWGNGSAGEKQTVWYRFPTRELSVRQTQTLDLSGTKVYFREFYTHRSQSNYETVLDKVTDGGVTITEEYGSNLIYSRVMHDARAEAKLERRSFDCIASVSLNALNARASQMYPYVTEASLLQWHMSLAPAWRIRAVELGFSADFGFGDYDENEWKVTDASGVLTSPYRHQEYFDKWIGYETSTWAGISPFVRVPLKGGIYIQADGSFVRDLSQNVGGSRYAGFLRLGWDF